MRDKPFLGMHLAAIDTCSQASLQVLVEELQILWHEGFEVDGEHYVVALIEIVCDGRGREKIKKVQGGGSHKGCMHCNFPGTHSVIELFIEIGQGKSDRNNVKSTLFNWKSTYVYMYMTYEYMYLTCF